MSYKLSMIIALAAIASVQQLVHAKDIYQLCSQFDQELKQAVGGVTDRDVNYQKGQELLLTKESPLDSKLRQQLAVSWEAIRLDKGANCDNYGDRSIKLLRDCRPLEFDHLKATLGADVQAFTEMCSCDDLWGPKLNMALEKVGSARDKVENFMNVGFLEGHASDSGKANGENDFRLATSFNHFEPSLAGRAGLSSMVRIYNEKYKTGGLEYFKKNPDSIESYLKSWLVKPCAKYVKAVGPVMESALDYAQLYEKGEQEFLKKQTEFFKDSMFRYEFCSKLALDLQRSAFFEAMRNSL